MTRQAFNPFADMIPLFPELLEQPVAPNPYDAVNCFDMLDVERELEGRVCAEMGFARQAGAAVPHSISELDWWSLRQNPATFSLSEAVGALEDWQDSWDRRPSDRVCESSLGDTMCWAACLNEAVTPVEII